MRIKDLATRATKLLTGNAWFVVDNGTKVEKAAYSEVVKQGIEEYAGSTLAGSAQTVKSAIDALNSKILPSINYTGNLNDAPEGVVYTSSGVTNTPVAYDYWFVHTMKSASDSASASQYAIARMGTNPPMFYRAKSGGTWTNWISLAKQSDVDTLNSKTGGFATSLGVDMNQNKTYEITTSQGYPIYFMFGQATGGSPFAVIIGGGGLTTANPTVYYQIVGSQTIIESVTAETNKIIIKFSNNYAQFTIMSRQAFTGQVKS